MFSNVLTSYQSCVITFLEKSSRALGAVSKTFYGYQPYEFSVIKVFAIWHRNATTKSLMLSTRY